ncbi:MAG: type II toxin-antitoxin system VapC family toxin [Bacteroides sp.]|nr:type II toxin-antitoxin system VapC family toxin [Bacteroides sp.]
MKQYLLDTSICVFLFRDKYGIEEKLRKIGPSQCYISEVTIAELKYGAYRSERTQENLKLIHQFVNTINVIPFIESIDFFAQEKNRLRALGTPIDDFDLLIGSAAYSRGLILVTDNLKHFANIQGLSIENWVNR